MEVTHYWHGDLKYRQIVSRIHKALALLKIEYEKKGLKSWLNLFNSLKDKWVLTIRLKD